MFAWSVQGSNFSTFSAILAMFSFLLLLFNHSHPNKLLGTYLYVSLSLYMVGHMQLCFCLYMCVEVREGTEHPPLLSTCFYESVSFLEL